MSNFTREVFSTVGHHFVTSSWVSIHPDSEEEKLHIYSGFLVDVQGFWFVVTAGHVVSEIKTALASNVIFTAWRLDDQTAGNRFKGIAVPFEFELDAWILLEDESVGFDYAAMLVKNLYRAGLEAGNATAMDHRAWGDHKADHDYWALVGLPSETVTLHDEDKVKGTIYLEPLDATTRPSVIGDQRHCMFYGKLRKDFNKNYKSIKGMSGGPIFSLVKSDQQWQYRVIGIQSSWIESLRTVCICPINLFLERVTKLVEDILDNNHV